MADRAKKYAAKLSGDNRKLLYDRQKGLMSRLEKEHTEELVKIEKDVKQITQGESTTLLPYYIIFAKELYRIKNRHRSTTLIREAEILEEKWRARGLRYDLLDRIKLLYIQAYATIAYFKLDISELDGPNVLA